jgi:hypothetical protein
MRDPQRLPRLTPCAIEQAWLFRTRDFPQLDAVDPLQQRALLRSRDDPWDEYTSLSEKPMEEWLLEMTLRFWLAMQMVVN